MSYCRWSCDNFRCDLYTYESDDGFVIHVAGNRIVGDIPSVPDILTSPAVEYVAAYQARAQFLKTAEREPITLPHAGETIIAADLEEFDAWLHDLRALGYNFPDHVLEEVAEELKAEKGKPTP